MHNATGPQHTERHLPASRHHNRPLMVDSRSGKGPKPSPLPKRGGAGKLELAAKAPGTPPSPGRQRGRRLHARGGGAGSTMVPGAAAAAPCPLARRALASSCKLSGSTRSNWHSKTGLSSTQQPQKAEKAIQVPPAGAGAAGVLCSRGNQRCGDLGVNLEVGIVYKILL